MERLKREAAERQRMQAPLREEGQRRGSLTRRQVLRWAIPAGVGVVWVSVASQFLGNQSPTIERLERFLKAKQWKEADQETTNLMLKVANREKEHYLDSDSIKNFPYEVLSKIDRLWVDNSSSKFGFSVQKQICVEACGGKPNVFDVKV